MSDFFCDGTGDHDRHRIVCRSHIHQQRQHSNPKLRALLAADPFPDKLQDIGNSSVFPHQSNHTGYQQRDHRNIVHSGHAFSHCAKDSQRFNGSRRHAHDQREYRSADQYQENIESDQGPHKNDQIRDDLQQIVFQFRVECVIRLTGDQEKYQQ